MFLSDSQAHSSVSLSLLQFTSHSTLTSLVASDGVAKFESGSSLVSKWTRVSIGVKLHNLYSLHLRAEGVEEQASGSDLNELAFTPVTIQASLYTALFR